MKSAVLALAATVFLALPGLTLAQTAAGAGGAGATAGAGDAGAAAGGGAGGKGGKMKAAMDSCRTEVKSQGVKGADRKKAVEDCVLKAHPEFAGRMQCRDEAKAKGLSGDDMKSYVKTCAKAARNHG